MARKSIVKLVSLGVLVILAVVMSTMALAQIAQTNDDRVTHLADIADYDGYLVKDVEGYVGVFYLGHGYPAFITRIATARLRGVDREDVIIGIEVSSRMELMQLLEDLGS